MDFLLKAKVIVVNYYNDNTAWNRGERVANDIDVDDVHIVWFSKTLQNWKATLITTRDVGTIYYELTYDGDEKVTFVDVYEKRRNVRVPD